MATEVNDSFTELQREILHAHATDSYESATHIAEQLDCSASYVRETIRDSQDTIENIQALAEANYMPIFSKPYSVLIPENLLSFFHFSPGDILELTFEIDGERETTYGSVEVLEDETLSPYSHEHRARVQGAYFGADELNQEDRAPFTDFPTIDDGRANISTSDEFRTFINTITQTMRESIGSGIHLFIGVGILEIIHGERNPSNLISTPDFILERDHFSSYLINEGPELVDTRLYLGVVSSPEEVYFTCYGEHLSEEQRRNAHQLILEQEYFKSSWNYSLPGYQALVGPTTTKRTDDIVRVTDDALQIVTGVRQPVYFYSDAEHDVFADLDGETVQRAIHDANPQFESLASHSRHSNRAEGLPIRQNDNQLIFLFDQVTLVLIAEGDHITWLRPDNIDHIETIVDAVNNMIKEQLGLEKYEAEDVEQPESQRVEPQDWVFDTNALYHDHVADQPTSILHTIYYHQFFHQSTIHIPQAVLFEMNKHPESGSASKSANEQGFENLSMIRSLEQLGFLSVEVQECNSELITDLSNGDIADIHILAYADTCDACLITGDQSLCDVSNLYGVDAVNIRQLSTLTTPVGDDSTLNTEVLGRIGTELSSKTEILEKIENHINQGATVPTPESNRQVKRSPDEILRSWETQDEVLPYYRSSDGEVCYARRFDVSVVATKSVLTFLPEYLDDDSQEFLTESFLENVASDVHEGDSNELPAIELTVPSEYIIKNAADDQAPSEFNQGVLELSRAKNIEYRSEPAMNAQTELLSETDFSLSQTSENSADGDLLSPLDYLALCLATSTGETYLLLPDKQNGLWKYSKLLGIKTITAIPPTPDDNQ